MSKHTQNESKCMYGMMKFWICNMDRNIKSKTCELCINWDQQKKKKQSQSASDQDTVPQFCFLLAAKSDICFVWTKRKWGHMNNRRKEGEERRSAQKLKGSGGFIEVITNSLYFDTVTHWSKQEVLILFHPAGMWFFIKHSFCSSLSGGLNLWMNYSVMLC